MSNPTGILLCLAMYQIIQANTLPPLKPPFRQSEFCKCGAEKGSGRIVGGKEVRPYRYPWMALIGTKTSAEVSMKCAGSLINSKYVLTAAHCLVHNKKTIASDSLKVFLGLHDLEETTEKNVFDVERVISHEEFQYERYSNDIGLILLKEYIDPNKYHYICLPEMDEDYTDKKTTVIGWGSEGEWGGISKKLLEVNLTIISMEACKQDHFVGDLVKPSMVCTVEKGKDACAGDSGGPLMLSKQIPGKKQVQDKENDYYWEEIGIVSFGYGCARPGVAAIFTRVAYFLDWIYANTEDAMYCKNPNTERPMNSFKTEILSF